MRLKELHIAGFKSFAKKTALSFDAPITAIVGPNGSGKSNTAEAFRFALGEQSMKALRGKRGEDLIWDGSRNLPKASRASVKVVFDNRLRPVDLSDGALGVGPLTAISGRRGANQLNVDFDEVAIERIVFRDASHEYLVNGTRVRLKDILELLAGAHVGATGHHIISQGEADRILLASPKERKMMVEEALGLRLYHIRKAEAEKKRAETAVNRKEAAALRREIAPHLNFLKKQVERAEEAEQLKARLIGKYRAYFSGEFASLGTLQNELSLEKHAVEERLTRLKTVSENDTHQLEKEDVDPRREEISELDRSLGVMRSRRQEEARLLGRLEGKLSAFEEVVVVEVDTRIAREDVAAFVADLGRDLEELVHIEDVSARAVKIAKLRQSAVTFLDRMSRKTSETSRVKDSRRAEIVSERDTLLQTVAQAGQEEASLLEKRVLLEREIAVDRHVVIERERERFAREAELREAMRLTADIAGREVRQREIEAALKREQAQAAIIFGRGVIYESNEKPAKYERVELREIERMKATLEAIDPGASEAVLREYEATRDRDAFLARELADLERTDDSLASLIKELEAELSRKFAEGVHATSARFHELFSVMFDGGKAALVVSRSRPRKRADGDEEAETDDASSEDGIEIEVALPRKKTKGLHALSGGERALSAIALTFAIAQVNPPPFLILDETDAALDEANSRRYGDMIERIAEHSQLILITHNRETMSRAGILYGITMGADGASELLSVKLDEALAVAK